MTISDIESIKSDLIRKSFLTERFFSQILTKKFTMTYTKNGICTSKLIFWLKSCLANKFPPKPSNNEILVKNTGL